MPVHTHHAAERLKPEWIAHTGQQFRCAVMVEDALRDSRTELRHPFSEPRGHTAAMQRQIGGS